MKTIRLLACLGGLVILALGFGFIFPLPPVIGIPVEQADSA
jgi:hypothetical protein